MNKKRKMHQPKPGSNLSQTAAKPSGKLPDFVFGRENYMLVLAGIALIALGFILMIGGGSEDPKVFNDDIFNFRRLTLAPILVLAGYALEIYAIMHRPRTKVQEREG